MSDFDIIEQASNLLASATDENLFKDDLGNEVTQHSQIQSLSYQMGKLTQMALENKSDVTELKRNVSKLNVDMGVVRSKLSNAPTHLSIALSIFAISGIISGIMTLVLVLVQG